MYKACRHIKPSGLRCKSRALAGANFCYFHSGFHNPATGPATEHPETEPLKLPVLEDLASIPIAVARISEALIANRIDVKVSAQLFWGLKLAYQAIAGRDDEQPYSVLSVTQSEQGDDLAPDRIFCVREDDCSSCKDSKTCTNSWFYDPPDLFEEKEEEEEEEEEADDQEEEDNNEEADDDEDDEDNKDEDQEAHGDDEEDDDEEADDDEEDDDDNNDDEEDEDDIDEGLDNETTEELIADAKYLESVSNALNVGDMRQAARLLGEPVP
jgi:hypothetical protein